MTAPTTGTGSRLPVQIEANELASALRLARLMLQPGSTYTFGAYRDAAALARFVLSIDPPHHHDEPSTFHT
jgi:hypothetical protein